MDVFLGSIYPKELLEQLVKRKQFVDFPAQTFQQALLKGLKDKIESLRVVTSPVIRSKYNIVKNICSKKAFSSSDTNVEEDIYVGTTVIPGIQMFSEFIRVYCCLKKLFAKSSDNTLFIYALHSPFLLAAILLRKKIACICVVVPDLPEYMSSNVGYLKRLGKRIDRKLINYCLKRIDCSVLLSSYMRERLPIANKPWTLVEGIYNEETSIEVEKSKNNKEKIILYTGNLSERTGIIELLQAFKQIKSPDYRLWIRGNGATKGAVLKAEKDDKRIKYFTSMSVEELRTLQKKATVLINPVRGSHEFTKYFFPSKTMEYLASGTPAIMYKLLCLPQDYYPYIYFVEEETVDSLREKIVMVCEKPQQELDEFGKKASEFIKTQKNAFVQTQKIVDMVRNIR